MIRSFISIATFRIMSVCVEHFLTISCNPVIKERLLREEKRLFRSEAPH